MKILPDAHAGFLFDFGSPNACLCHKVPPEIESRTGVRFECVPILLGDLFKLANNRSPVESFAASPDWMAWGPGRNDVKFWPLD